MTRTITDLLALREGITRQETFTEDYPKIISWSYKSADEQPYIDCVAALPELFDAMERMRDALKPFADFNTEDFPDSMRAFEDDPTLTMGHFRRARAALANRSEG